MPAADTPIKDSKQTPPATEPEDSNKPAPPKEADEETLQIGLQALSLHERKQVSKHAPLVHGRFIRSQKIANSRIEFNHSNTQLKDITSPHCTLGFESTKEVRERAKKANDEAKRLEKEITSLELKHGIGDYWYEDRSIYFEDSIDNLKTHKTFGELWAEIWTFKAMVAELLLAKLRNDLTRVFLIQSNRHSNDSGLAADSALRKAVVEDSKPEILLVDAVLSFVKNTEGLSTRSFVCSTPELVEVVGGARFYCTTTMAEWCKNGEKLHSQVLQYMAQSSKGSKAWGEDAAGSEEQASS